MPHFGLIPPGLKPHEELLMRAKLHVHGGRLRMDRGSKADALAAFYDAFLSAMQSFFISPAMALHDDLSEVKDLDNARELFDALKKNRIINESFTNQDFKNLQDRMERVLKGEIVGFDVNFIPKYEDVMTQLGVLPIKESELPKEDSVTL